jgi:mitochondrial intermediate peptidase
MLKNTALRPWICARCLSQRNQHPNRLRSTVAAAQSYDQRPVPAKYSAPGAIHDDKALRNIFDSAGFWKDFSQTSKANSTSRSNGLFQNRYLTSPRGFELFANTNLRKAKGIVEKVLRASSTEQYKTIAKDLDRLSDMLCRVIDLSDFVRSTHPDHKIQAAASRAHAKMFEYMNVLNTTTGLNEQLGIAMANQDIMNNWTEEEKVVARSLKRDFAKSAISLPKAIRERFVSLSQEISETGHIFVEDMAPARETISIPSSKLKGMDPILVRSLTSWGHTSLPAVGDLAAAALRSVRDEDTRKEIFMASKTASQNQILRLEELLRKRAELASITGYNSYSELALGDKMAKSPQSVDQFLQAVSGENKPRVQKEMGELLDTKMRDANVSMYVLQPWDKEFYTSQVRSSMRSTSRSTDFLSSYFSLGTVMQGLSRLFTQLYGIRFVPHETMPGETWNEDVRRLDIVSETDGHVAVLYCDLFTRPGKSPNPAHFTLRCSREITEEELEEARSSPNVLFSTPEEDVNDGMSTSRSSGVLKQLPTIALICDFRTSSKPSLLTFGEVQTLFHEMGHAIHSILGRTSLQEVSGTRCPTDFAELPSVLMEHFAADPSVLSLFARHYETDQPLPYELVAEKLALDRRFAGSDTEQQIILAMLDQAYHSSLPLSPSFNSTQVLHEIQRTHGVLPPDPPGTCWQGLFGHLAGYGSTYYSYLFDQVLAERIWQVVFKSGHGGASIDRANGERMKERVLRWGGGRDPWRCVAEVLDDGRVEGGDEAAMRVVGSWWAAKGRST